MIGYGQQQQGIAFKAEHLPFRQTAVTGGSCKKSTEDGQGLEERGVKGVRGSAVGRLV